MTQTHCASDLYEQRLPLLEAVCRSEGMRLTHQRMEIFREIICAKDHPSAEAVYQRVKKRLPSISLDTVYRTLGTFADKGLIAKLQVAAGSGRFEPDNTPHHHLFCTKCQEITDFSWEAFENISPPAALKFWGRIDNRHVVVSGVCRRCQEEGQ